MFVLRLDEECTVMQKYDLTKGGGSNGNKLGWGSYYQGLFVQILFYAPVTSEVKDVPFLWE